MEIGVWLWSVRLSRSSLRSTYTWGRLFVVDRVDTEKTATITLHFMCIAWVIFPQRFKGTALEIIWQGVEKKAHWMQLMFMCHQWNIWSRESWMGVLVQWRNVYNSMLVLPVGLAAWYSGYALCLLKTVYWLCGKVLEKIWMVPKLRFSDQFRLNMGWYSCWIASYLMRMDDLLCGH